MLLVVFDFVISVVHGHGRGKRLGIYLAVKPCVSCLSIWQHLSMHHLSCSPKADRHTRYVLVPQKGRKIGLPQKRNQHVQWFYM